MWNVRDLLEGPGGGDASLVAGGPTAEWSLVQIATEERQLPPSGGSGIAVLVGKLPTEAWRLDATIRRVHDKGYSVLVVDAGAFSDEGTLRLAQRLELAILEAPSPLSIARTCWELEAAQDSVLVRLVRDITNATAGRFDTVVEMLTQISRATKFGIALVHRDAVVAQAGGPTTLNLLDVLSFERRAEVVRTKSTTIAAVRIDVQPLSESRLVMYTLHGEQQLPPSMLLTLVEVAAPAVGSKLLTEEARGLSDASSANTLMQDFLECRGEINGDVDRRMRERGWNTTGYHLGFRILPAARANILPLIREVHREFAIRGIRVHLAASGKAILGWMTYERLPSRASIDERVRAVRDVHSTLRRNWNVSCAVGGLHPEWKGLATTLDEAFDASRVAEGLASSGYFLRVDDLRADQLMLAWTRGDAFGPAAASLLSPLLQRDQSLIRTLSAYLDNGAAVQSTAEQLGVHRNTVTSHVQRIQTLLNVDLRDPDTRLSLQLACRAVKQRMKPDA